MTTATAIKLLERALAEQGRLAEHVRRFQEAVFEDESLEGPTGEVLRDLAHDLDFYEPELQRRNEDPALFGDARAAGEIRQALEQIRTLGQHRE